MSRFLKIAGEFKYGQVHANSISIYTSPTDSQGGVKGSEFGRQNGKCGGGEEVDELVAKKFVS